MLLQIITMHTAIFADRAILLWELQIWDKIIPHPQISKPIFSDNFIIVCLQMCGVIFGICTLKMLLYLPTMWLWVWIGAILLIKLTTIISVR